MAAPGSDASGAARGPLRNFGPGRAELPGPELSCEGDRMFTEFTLVSHHLCPYVQRAVIAAEKLSLSYCRITIDLAAKPDWFLALSPTGKVPMLQVMRAGGERVALFESAAIAEFLNDVGGGGLLAADPVERARQRGWIEFASGTLAEIAGLYAAADAAAFAARAAAIAARLGQVEAVVKGPWFSGDRFSLVDAAFGPLFRYCDLFERRIGLRLADGLERIGAWRTRLAADPIVAGAVAPDYPEQLEAFLRARGSHLSRLLAA